MIFFNEEFEYLVHNTSNPSNRDMHKIDYDGKEYKILEWHRVYVSMMLTELGAKGWELIIRSDDSYEKEGGGTVAAERLIFKRSSRSKHYKTGFGVNTTLISDLAKKQAGSEHVSL